MNELRSENELCIVLTTEASISSAECLAKEILRRKIVACISFKEIKSLFWWEDTLADGMEVQLIIKTTFSKIDILIETIKEFHSYQIPEIIFWKVSSDEKYRQWVHDVVGLLPH